MTLEDIKAAVDAGQTVHWANTGYVVHKDRLGQYLITYLPNGSCIGLTDRERAAVERKRGGVLHRAIEGRRRKSGQPIKTRRAGEGRSTRRRGGIPTRTAALTRGRG